MRWFVEVSHVGEGSSSERYCIEAKAWQAALQEARKLRGDAGPLSKFSIELLDDGYRAVDPVQKIRYVVNQAPADSAVSVPSAAPATNGAVASPALASSPPPAAKSPAAAPPAPPAAPSAPAPAAPSAAAASSSPAPSAPAPSAPAPLPSSPPASSAPVPSSRMVSITAPPAASPVPSPAPSNAPAPSPSVPVSPPTPLMPSVVSSPAAAPAPSPAVTPLERPRSEVPRAAASAPPAAAASPRVLTPAEAPRPKTSSAPKAPEPSVFAMAPTPPEHRVQSTRVEPPKPEAPITYREEVYIVEPGTAKHSVEVLLLERFERVRAELASSPPGQLVRLAVFDVAFEGRPPHPPLGTLAWKDWRGAPVLGFPFFGEEAPPMTSSLPPRPDQELDRVVAPPNPPLPAIEAATSKPAPAASKSDPAPAAAAALAPRRAASDDLIGDLFERLAELMFANGVVAAASYLLDALAEVIPTEFAIAQVFDLNTRSFVVVRARGPGLERALLEATIDSDPLISAVMHARGAQVFRAEGDERFQRGRWKFAAAPLEHVLSGAVRQGGRYLGLVELANPAGGAPFGANEINALDYACEQFAEFVATHPVVIDRDVVLGG